MADKVTFQRVVQAMKDLSVSKDKGHVFRQLMDEYLEAHGRDKRSTLDIYPLVRLFLPHLDYERKNYNMKEKKLAGAYIYALGLKHGQKMTQDAKALINYMKTDVVEAGSTMKTGENTLAGNFPAILSKVLQQRMVGMNSQTPTVARVNDILDRLHKASNDKEKNEVVKEISETMNVVEQVYVARIILQDSKNSFKHGPLLKALDGKQAVEHYSCCNDLKETCKYICDKLAGVKVEDVGVRLFSAVTPMLAATVDNYTNAIKAFNNEDFMVETKFDGERILLHYDCSKDDGERFRLLTRNANDYTKLYTPVLAAPFMEATGGKTSCILDGELVNFDTNTKTMQPFGNNKTIAIAKAEGQEAEGYEGCVLKYMAFDILYYDGRDVTKCPLHERRILLAQLVKKPVEDLFEVVPFEQCYNMHDVLRTFDAAMKDNHEGIIIKNMKSQYIPSCRDKDKWVKLKPDYIDGLAIEMDLVIIGGYYGTGRRGGDFSHFLLGCKEIREEDDSIFIWPVTKVGSGYTYAELDRIRERLKDFWRKDKPKNMGSLEDKPHMWIDPRDSIVFEVKSFEIIAVTEKSFECQRCLRFPRVQKIRDDKNWYDIQTLADVNSMLVSQVNKNSAAEIYKEHMANPVFTTPKKRKPPPRESRINKRAAQPEKRYQILGEGQVAVEGDLFKGMVFFLPSFGNDEGSAAIRDEVQRKIFANGGKAVANYKSANVTGTVAAKKTPQVKNLLDSNKDVLHYRWILDSVESGRLIPWSTNYFVGVREPATLKKLKSMEDEFNDSYTDFIQNSSEAMKAILDNVDLDDLGEGYISQEDMDDVEDGFKYAMFKRLNIYLDVWSEPSNPSSTHILHSPVNAAAVWIKMYGGRISTSVDPSVTHIIVDVEDLSRVDALHKLVSTLRSSNVGVGLWMPHFVTMEWVEASIREEWCADTRRYAVPRK